MKEKKRPEKEINALLTIETKRLVSNFLEKISFLFPGDEEQL